MLRMMMMTESVVRCGAQAPQVRLGMTDEVRILSSSRVVADYSRCRQLAEGESEESEVLGLIAGASPLPPLPSASNSPVHDKQDRLLNSNPHSQGASTRLVPARAGGRGRGGRVLPGGGNGDRDVTSATVADFLSQVFIKISLSEMLVPPDDLPSLNLLSVRLHSLHQLPPLWGPSEDKQEDGHDYTYSLHYSLPGEDQIVELKAEPGRAIAKISTESAEAENTEEGQEKKEGGEKAEGDEDKDETFEIQRTESKVSR
eukprot:746230-Hanusia_phi.AAC.12